MAESTWIYPTQCRKLKSNRLTVSCVSTTNKMADKWGESNNVFIQSFRANAKNKSIQRMTINWSKVWLPETAMKVYNDPPEWNYQGVKPAQHMYAYRLVQFDWPFKIYSCWFTPNFTRNHVISYTNKSIRFLTLITIMAFKSRSINTQTLIVSVCKPSLACCVILTRIFLTSILRKERNREI